MKLDDTLMPYILASMHPMLKLSLVTSSVIKYSLDNERVLTLAKVGSDTDEVAKKFIKIEKF